MKTPQYQIPWQIGELKSFREDDENFRNYEKADDEVLGLAAWNRSSDICGEDINEMWEEHLEKKRRENRYVVSPSLENYGLCWRDFV